LGFYSLGKPRSIQLSYWGSNDFIGGLDHCDFVIRQPYAKSKVCMTRLVTTIVNNFAQITTKVIIIWQF
jgi:hypothetical protein